MGGLGSADIVLFDGFRLDRSAGCLFRLGPAGVAAPIAIGSRALGLLELLIERKGELVSKEAIMKALWPSTVVEEGNLTVQVSALRRILDQNRKQGSCIQTVSGRGYCFVVPVTQPGIDAHAAIAPISQSGVNARRYPSIVVLPFANLSDDREQQYFADGVTDDLTTELSRLPDLFVISRNTAFTYRNTLLHAKQIGRELGVRYVLEGSIRRSREQVRINSQLIDADTDTHLWAARFDRQRLDLLELQDEVAIAIAGAIEPELLKFERNRIAGQPQHVEDAYEFYQRGMWCHYRHNKADNIAAQDYFRRALAIDPQHPQATAALAISVCNAAYLGWAEDIEANYAEAYDLGQRAVGLDARYPNAHFALGLVCMWTRRSDRAITAFRETIKLNPSCAAAHVLLGQIYLYDGRLEEAIALAEKGIRLSPTDPRLFIWLPALAGAHYQLGHYSEAVEIGRRAWVLNRNWPAGLRYVVAGLGQLGRIGEAQAVLGELRTLDTSLAFVEGILTRVYRDRAGVEHFLDGLRKAGMA
jgi:TolB-like protein/Flp pilus assembly protein TadD